MAESFVEQSLTLLVHADLTDLFWLTPEQIGAVNELVTTAKLSTMVIGTKTREHDFVAERDYLNDVLAAPTAYEPQRKRALDIGFMYGSLLVGEDDSAEPQSQLPEAYWDLMDRIMTDIDGTNPNDANRLFMKLRDVEVAITGSDILAFCLAASQDHLSNQFSTIQQEDTPISHHELTWQQSLFYAGALTAALLKADTANFPLPNLEITSSMRDGENPVNIIVELEASDDLPDIVEYQLSQRYQFVQGKADHGRGRDVIGISAGGIQFGPNQISIASLIPSIVEPEIVLDAKKLDQIVMGRRNDNGTVTLQVHHDLKNTSEEDEIIAMERAGYYISKYSENHPHNQIIADVLRTGSRSQKKEVTYANAESMRSLEYRLPTKRAMRFVLVGSLISTWSPEAEDIILGNGFHPNWLQGTAASLVWLGMYKAVNSVQRKIVRHRLEDPHLHLGGIAPYVNEARS